MKRYVKLLLVTLAFTLGSYGLSATADAETDEATEIGMATEFLRFQQTVNSGAVHISAVLNSDIELGCVCGEDAVTRPPIGNERNMIAACLTGRIIQKPGFAGQMYFSYVFNDFVAENPLNI